MRNVVITWVDSLGRKRKQKVDSLLRAYEIVSELQKRKLGKDHKVVHPKDKVRIV